MAEQQGWIGFDLDGTLAFYDEWRGIEHIGPPVPRIVALAKRYHDMGHLVCIFTARVSRKGAERNKAIKAIQAWAREHLGFVPRVTNVKDFGMIMLYDDRCVQVECNTGRLLEDAGTDRGNDGG